MGDPIKIRIPFLENLATQYGGVFARDSRMLTSTEIDMASPIFAQSVNYNQVKIVSTHIIAAPTTLGNNIRIPPGYHLGDDVLIHEMTHIWQFQTRGNGYISDSLLHQTAAIIAGGDRNMAYAYDLTPGKSFYHYTAEQQAMIVQHYFTDTSLHTHPDYIRMISELRSARPILTDMERYQESLYGNGYRNDRFFEAISPTGMGNAGIVPVVRIEF